jgi:hypothetical protein
LLPRKTTTCGWDRAINIQLYIPALLPVPLFVDSLMAELINILRAKILPASASKEVLGAIIQIAEICADICIK